MRFIDAIEATQATQVAQTGLMLLQSDIWRLHADAIACYASTSLTLHSNLAQQLVASGGSFIRAESGKHAPAQVGEAVVLPAGKLPARYLIVGVTNRLRDAPTLENISACIAAIARQASLLGLRSLAIPSLRVGRALAPEDVLRAMVAPLFDHCSGPGALSQLLLVSDDGDPIGAHTWAHTFVRMGLDELAELGRLRAQAAALRNLEEGLAATMALGSHAVEELLALQLDIQGQIQGILEHSLALARPGRRAIALELRQCEDEQERLHRALSWSEQAPLERAVGE